MSLIPVTDPVDPKAYMAGDRLVEADGEEQATRVLIQCYIGLEAMIG